MANTDFSPEQVSDIKAAYRNAANPEKQIGILAELYDTTENTIREILGLSAAPNGTKKKRIYRSYDQAVKEDVVRAVLLDGMTNREAAEKFSVPYGNVLDWVNKARKKQAEFSRFAEEVEAEQTAAPAASPENKVKKTANHGPSKMSQDSSPTRRKPLYERAMQEAKEGVSGLDEFITDFAGIDIFSEDELNMLDRIQERAAGYLYGLETGIELMKEEARSNARDS